VIPESCRSRREEIRSEEDAEGGRNRTRGVVGTGLGGRPEQDAGGAWQLPELGRRLAASGGGWMEHACAGGARLQTTFSSRLGNFGAILAMDRGRKYQRIVILTSRWHILVISRCSALLPIREFGKEVLRGLHVVLAQLLESSSAEFACSALLHRGFPRSWKPESYRTRPS
jgi:hypothetical protein